MASAERLPRLGLILLVGLTLVWGLNWPIMKIALFEIPPWTFRAVTCVLGGGGLLISSIVASRLHGSLVIPPRRQWLPLVAASLCNITTWHMCTAYGLIYMPAGHTALIAFTMPVWATVLGVLFLKERPTARRLLGLALGTAGILILLPSGLAFVPTAPLGTLFALGAAFGWATGTIIVKRVSWSIPTPAVAGWQLLIGSVPIIPVALLAETVSPGAISAQAWLASAFVVVAALWFAYYAWFKIVSLFPASVAVVCTLMVPVIGLVTGALMLNEPLGWREGVSAVLVATALFLVLMPGRRLAREAALSAE